VAHGKNEMQQYPNIFLLGVKPYSLLPYYLSCMDVCLIPFTINKLTLAANPVKLYEYLAAGKPVVSTELPEVLINASEVASIAKNDVDFIRKVECAVHASKDPQEKSRVLKRITFAKENSWQKRVEGIEKVIVSLKQN
jgi:glycosyltransferase involved in cell wall biosynthesis